MVPAYCQVLIGIAGTRVADDEIQLLQNPLCAGVVLFRRNFTDPRQLAGLCAGIKAVDDKLFIAVDQEGGRVQRFCDGFTVLPPLSIYGDLYEEDAEQAMDYAYRHGRVMAGELRAHGVDLSFAPVLDVHSASTIIADRAFSTDTDVITRLGRAMIGGMHDAGMAAVGKHFPGHGSVLADTHTDVVSDPRPLRQIMDYDLQPFQALANLLEGMMMAHVCYPGIDELPVGYSSNWIRNILRRQLGFGGIVIADDLDMAAGAVVGDMARRLQSCSKAGCDLALICKAESAADFLNAAGNVEVLPAAMHMLRPTRAPLSMEEMLSVGEFRQWQQTMRDLSRQV